MTQQDKDQRAAFEAWWETKDRSPSLKEGCYSVWQSAIAHVRQQRYKPALNQDWMFDTPSQPAESPAKQSLTVDEPTDAQNIAHAESCTDDDCERCEAMLEFYMACDGCGRVGNKNADGWVKKADQYFCLKCAEPVKGPSAMTPERASMFLCRFKLEEKMLGPNEQAALDYALQAIVGIAEQQAQQDAPTPEEDEAWSELEKRQ
ncbi:hypothetical protein LKR43_13890 [Pusillimonas sp. MFBS29]|uniref:hypothetical protein n=1 Tax=Pusillimonas sp. MFBS29 TaxID=2886690 RepID=UPI001D118B73|nr:hypothetical protein [Pusillimonas sp. MFBS29]MCC2597429.1 hypothetical protein [Pusillimonas sp. MFBS29]